MRKPVVAVLIVALSLAGAATVPAALRTDGSGGGSEANAADAPRPLVAGPTLLAGCTRRAPARLHAEWWSLARRDLAPAGASRIRLCRYSGLNNHPPLAPVRSVLVSAPSLVRKLVREFDQLPSQGPSAIACPSDDGSQILAVLAYPGSRVVTIAVHLQGCEEVTNESVARLAAGFGSPPAFGTKLVAQLKRLTRRVRPTPAGYQRVHPPTPQVSTLGLTRSGTLVSYCWSEPLAGGGGRGVCADGAPGHPAHSLLWRPGAMIRIDLLLPAHNVQIQAVRITGGFGGRQSDAVKLGVLRVDRAGRVWSTRLPRRAAQDTDLLISANLANGDLFADLGQHRTSPAST